MNMRERLYLVFISLILACCALLAGSVATSYITPADIQYFFEGIYGSSAYLLAAALLLVAAVAILVVALRRGAGVETILRQEPLGEVRICHKAVETLVLKAAREIKGIKECKTRIMHSDSGLTIFIRAVTYPDQGIPQITAEVQSAVKEYVENATGVVVAEIRVMIENVVSDGMKVTKAAR